MAAFCDYFSDSTNPTVNAHTLILLPDPRVSASAHKVTVTQSQGQEPAIVFYPQATCMWCKLLWRFHRWDIQAPHTQMAWSRLMVWGIANDLWDLKCFILSKWKPWINNERLGLIHTPGKRMLASLAYRECFTLTDRSHFHVDNSRW